MERLYFTFGSDPAYPYGREDYVMILGKDRHDCIEAYRKRYPDRPGSGAYNAAMSYTAGEWPEIKERYYKDKEPAEVIMSDTVYGCKPEGYDPLYVFVPSQDDILYLQEGSGDALTDEDRESGMEDYLEFQVFHMADGGIADYDGGEYMLDCLVREKYGCLADAIPDILGFAYNNPFLDARILKVESGDDA